MFFSLILVGMLVMEKPPAILEGWRAWAYYGGIFLLLMLFSFCVFVCSGKKQMNKFLLAGVLLLLQACGNVIGYGTLVKKVDSSRIRSFSCSDKGKIFPDYAVRITTEDIRNCFFRDTHKVIWIHIFYVNCGSTDLEGVVKQWQKYKDEVELVMISVDYEIYPVKTYENSLNVPIYFIDTKYSSMRTKNTRLFFRDLLGDSLPEAYGNVFIYRGKVLTGSWGTPADSDFDSIFSKKREIKKTK